MDEAFIGGVPFMAVGHHDGRFIHAAGLFAFARRTPENRFLVLHLEICAALNRAAVPGHARWPWCLGQGMNTLLVHLSGRAVALAADTPADLETVLWHPDAQVAMGHGTGGVSAVEADAEDGERSRTAALPLGRMLPT